MARRLWRRVRVRADGPGRKAKGERPGIGSFPLESGPGVGLAGRVVVDQSLMTRMAGRGPLIPFFSREAFAASFRVKRASQ